MGEVGSRKNSRGGGEKSKFNLEQQQQIALLWQIPDKLKEVTWSVIYPQYFHLAIVYFSVSHKHSFQIARVAGWQR